MSEIKEFWRDVPDYEGYYQVSDLGRVRSLGRTVEFSDGRKRFYRGRLRKVSVNNSGYKVYSLNINGIQRTFQSSQLVAMAFLGHKPDGHSLVVDHVNGDKLDDRVDNLRIVTNRANTSTCFRSDEESFSSHYVGVCWSKETSKWRSQIRRNGVHIGLGYYDTEVEASNAYQEALSKIEDGSFDPNYYKPKFTSEYRGVTFHKASNKWQSRITINGKREYLGLFQAELEAHQAYLKAEKENNLSTH